MMTFSYKSLAKIGMALKLSPKPEAPLFIDVTVTTVYDETGEIRHHLLLQSSNHLVFCDHDYGDALVELGTSFFSKNRELFHSKSYHRGVKIEPNTLFYCDELDSLILDYIKEGIKLNKIRVYPNYKLSNSVTTFTNEGHMVLPASADLYADRDEIVFN